MLQFTLDLNHPSWRVLHTYPERISVAYISQMLQTVLWDEVREALRTRDAASGYFRDNEGQIIGEWRLTK